MNGYTPPPSPTKEFFEGEKCTRFHSPIRMTAAIASGFNSNSASLTPCFDNYRGYGVGKAVIQDTAEATLLCRERPERAC